LTLFAGDRAFLAHRYNGLVCQPARYPESLDLVIGERTLRAFAADSDLLELREQVLRLELAPFDGPLFGQRADTLPRHDHSL